MIKTTLALLAAGVLAASLSFAGGKSCCAAQGTQAPNENASWMNLAGLDVTADQNSKLVAWQNECMKEGCTKESRAAFMKKARTILSEDQYGQLKARCANTTT